MGLGRSRDRKWPRVQLTVTLELLTKFPTPNTPKKIFSIGKDRKVTMQNMLEETVREIVEFCANYQPDELHIIQHDLEESLRTFSKWKLEFDPTGEQHSYDEEE